MTALILTETREIVPYHGLIQVIVAEFAPPCFQHRNEFIVSGFEHGVGIDVENLDAEPMRPIQAPECCEHVVAQMAIGPDIEAENGAIPLSGPFQIAVSGWRQAS